MPVDSSFFQRQGWEANHAERTPSRPCSWQPLGHKDYLLLTQAAVGQVQQVS